MPPHNLYKAAYEDLWDLWVSNRSSFLSDSNKFILIITIINMFGFITIINLCFYILY